MKKPNKIGNLVDVKRQVRLCPKGKLCNCKVQNYPQEKLVKGEITFTDSTGFTNPYGHVLSCCFAGSERQLLDAYWMRQVMVTSKKAQGIGSFLTRPLEESAKDKMKRTPLINKKDEELFSWVEMIVMENFALSTVEKPLYRKNLKHQHRFSIKTVRDVILAMTAGVEKILAAEMQQAGRGSIVHDGWTKRGVHYLGLFATYQATRLVHADGMMTKVTAPVISLLSVSPLHDNSAIDDSDEEDEEHDIDGNDDDSRTDVQEAVEFTAQVHKNHIVDVLKHFYGIKNPKDWITNQTADSASVNVKLAQLLGIPHINCINHLLNNEVKNWFGDLDGDTATFANQMRFTPATVCSLVNKTMKDLSTNKSRALLLAETGLVPTFHNSTRWSSYAAEMQKWVQIEEHAEAVAANPMSNVTLPPTSIYFKRAAKNTKLILDDINAVVVRLQTRLLTLSEGRELIDELIDESETKSTVPGSHWYRNPLTKEYIASDSRKISDKDFVNAVSKLQKRQANTLTPAERRKVQKFLTPTAASDVDHNLSLAERLKKKSTGIKRKADESDLNKIKTDSCLDHVIASAAEVERLWSIARYILIDLRAKMAPILLEAILFLRYNRDLWDESTVMEARHEVREMEQEAKKDENEDNRLAQLITKADEQQVQIAEEMEQEQLEDEGEDDEKRGDEALLVPVSHKKRARTRKS